MVQNGRKLKLFRASWLPPPDSKASAIIVFHHGICEYISRYNTHFTQLAEAGIAVYAQDAHGHGRSEPTSKKLRVYVESFDDLVDDYMELMGEAVRKHPGLPVFAMGHSLGGLVVAHAAVRAGSNLAGLVLHSAAIDVEWTPQLKFIAAISSCLTTCCPFAKMVPEVNPQHISQDPEVVKAYLEDKLIYHGPLKNRMGEETLNSFRKMQKLGGRLKVPIYAAHGAQDHITSAKAVKALLESSKSTDTTFKVLDGGYHEMLFGPEREECMAALQAWILDHAVHTSTNRHAALATATAASASDVDVVA